MCEKVMCDDGIEREVVKAKDARKKNLPRYFTGKPCKNGHITERATNTRTCIGCTGLKSTEELQKEEEEKSKPRYAVDDDGVKRLIVTRAEAKANGYERYFTGEKCKRGHISERCGKHSVCLACESVRHKEYLENNREAVCEKKRRSYRKNAEKRRAERKAYYWKNPEETRRKRKEYYYKNQEKCIQQAKDYAKRNREKCNARSLERHHRLMKEDPTYRMTIQCRSMFRRVLDKTLKNKSGRTFDSLGYRPEDLRKRMESLFLEGMSWDNYGEWHIDHTKPISAFIQEGIDDPAVINSLDNLNPMWADHNKEKGAMDIGEFLESRPDLIPLYGHLLDR